MEKAYFLGLDVGTSLIKAVILDEAGNPCGTGSSRVEVDSPYPNWFQQDMGAVWGEAAAVIREAIARAGVNPGDIAVIGLTGQGDGAWMLDAAGEPLGPAPLWNDGRAGAVITCWQEQGLLAELYKKGGTTLWPGAQAAILTWLRENHPAVFNKIGTVLCCKDWIKYKLTGVICTDESDGSIPYMNMASRRYDDEQLRLLGLTGLKDKLPPITASHQVIGYVTTAAATETGLKAGTPVISGLLDVAASAVGLGVIHAGQSFTLIGTTAINSIVFDHPNLEPANIGATVCHGLPGHWMRVLGSMAGTPNLDWYLAQMGEIFAVEARQQNTDLFALLEKAVEAVPLGSGGIIFHPYLQGERAPFLDPLARAGFLGISAETTRPHLARSVYEGIALSIRDCFERVGGGVTEVRLAGGGANSRVWRQILADATGSTMVIPAGTHFGAVGAALAGAVGIGRFDDYQSGVEQWVKMERTYQPNPDNVPRYKALYALYHDLIERLTPFWAARQKFLDTWPSDP